MACRCRLHRTSHVSTTHSFPQYRQVIRSPICTAGEKELHARGQGDIDGLIWVAIGLMQMKFCDVLFVPEATGNILLVRQMGEQRVEAYMKLSGGDDTMGELTFQLKDIGEGI